MINTDKKILIFDLPNFQFVLSKQSLYGISLGINKNNNL